MVLLFNYKLSANKVIGTTFYYYYYFFIPPFSTCLSISNFLKMVLTYMCMDRPENHVLQVNNMQIKELFCKFVVNHNE